jgi:hypothetical protein
MENENKCVCFSFCSLCSFSGFSALFLGVGCADRLVFGVWWWCILAHWKGCRYM